MRSRLAALILIFLAGSRPLYAGVVYGTIFLRGKALPKATVAITCGSASDTILTLDDGSYRINMAQQGRCVLAVQSRSFPGLFSAQIVSSPGATEYNFDIVEGTQGLTMRRR